MLPYAVRRLVPAVLALLLVPAAAGAQERVRVAPLYARGMVVGATAPDTIGLRYRLSEGRGTGPAASAAERAVAGTRLTEAQVAALLARARALPVQRTAADSFHFPARTLPTPRAGATVVAGFPAPEASPERPRTPAPAPLTVTRRGPEGEVAVGAGVVVSFSQPMVPLSSVSETDAAAVPVRMSPQPPGRWRWLDVRTLVFEPRGRLPMATEYVVEVPAGARSATGGVMGEGVRWTFGTPAARVVGSWPNGQATGLRPVIVIAFDQRVSADAVLPTVRARSAGTAVALRVATAAEVQADEDARARVRGLPEGRWIALVPASPLPSASQVNVEVGPGTPSAEGPRRTTTVQEFAFRTYGPLRVRTSRCGWGGGCAPGQPFAIEMTNPLDTVGWRTGRVRVEPAIPGMAVDVSGTTIVIRGQTAPETTYRIFLSPEIRDRFAQRLGDTRPISIRVGTGAGRVWTPGGSMVILDPAGPPRVTFLSSDVGRVRVRVHRVTPESWARFSAGIRRPRDGGPAPLPGTEVSSREVSPGGAHGAAVATTVDVGPAMDGGLGHALVAIEPVSGSADQRRGGIYQWVQGTRTGLVALADGDSLLVWAASLADGAPVAGAQVSIQGAAPATTDARGLAMLPLPGKRQERQALLVRSGADVALLPEQGEGEWASWARQGRGRGRSWYLFTDRGLYRPGEEVRFKGWMRDAGREGPTMAAREGAEVRWRAADPQGNQVATGTARLTALGGFDGRFTVPQGSNLGGGSLQVHMVADSLANRGHLGFQVQEFRRPEFTVSMDVPPGPHVVGGHAELTAKAAYLAGGPLPGAATRWEATSIDAHFTPPGWEGWSFGAARDWWERGNGVRFTAPGLDGRTDAAGAHVLRIDFDRADPPNPSTLAVQATITDVNRQTWTANGSLLVHPAEVYAGLRTDRQWMPRGTPIEVQVAAVGIDGKAVVGRTVEVRAERVAGRMVGGEWEEKMEDVQECRVVSAATPLPCAFRTPAGGRWRVTARTTDAAGRPSRSRLGLWVSGEAAIPGQEPEKEAEVQMVADRETYRPGDTARILLRLPFFPARGVLAVTRGSIEETRSFRSDEPTVSVAVPIGERDVPNVGLRVEIVGSSAADGRPRDSASGIDHAAGALELRVPPVTRALKLAVTPRDTAMTPEGTSSVDVEVRDHGGRPVAGAEVALVVVDESVLALAGYDLPDPLNVFYPYRHTNISARHSRKDVVPVPRDFTPAVGTLVGTVRNAVTQEPVGGATVRLEGTDRAATTDAAGRFRLQGVGAGTWTLVVERADYGRAEMSVRVAGGEAHPALRISILSRNPEGDATQLNALVVTGAVAESRQRSGSDMMAPPAVVAPPPPPSPMAPPAPAAQAATGAMADAAGRPGPAINVRANFVPLAVFVAAATTDAGGRISVPFTLPSNLTRYRVMAVAVHGEQRFGTGESGITARQPLMVRPSAPRFLNFGDRFDLPVVLQNQTGAPMTVDVAVRASGLSLAEAGKRVTVPAGDRVEVRFAAEATQAGPAHVQIVAASGRNGDAAELTLPVYTPATTESFATHGTVDDGQGPAVLPLRVPADAIPSFGGLEVTTSSTALQELTDAVLYLTRYPYECSEQIASRLMAVAALRDVMSAFRAPGLPSADSVRASVERDIRLLAALQNDDGGFPFWERGDESWPYVSVHVAHALARAREKGYAVPEAMIQRSQRYLREVDRHMPAWYPVSVRRAIQTYAVYTRGKLGDRAAAGQARIMAERLGADSLTAESAAWLLTTIAEGGQEPAIQAQLLRVLRNRATETASTATFATRYEDGEYLLLHSSRRTDGVVLEALMAADSTSDLIPKTVRGLLGSRRAGRWLNTQENVWILLALDRYFRAYERATPDFLARVWLGERFAGEHAFRGRTTERFHLEVPMRALGAAGRETTLTLGKEGTGRMYWRAGLRYAPRDLDVVPLSRGFSVERTYEAVDDSTDVRRAPDGRWVVKAGVRVRVTVTMTVPARRVHVALVDPLPAGFEAVNAELQGTRRVPPATPAPGRGRPGNVLTVDQDLSGWGWGWWWRWSWFEHQNLRDDRAEAFATQVRAGTHTYSYVARATTPGIFIVPPPRAEEMYSPETFGRGGTDRVTIEAPAPR